MGIIFVVTKPIKKCSFVGVFQKVRHLGMELIGFQDIGFVADPGSDPECPGLEPGGRKETASRKSYYSMTRLLLEAEKLIIP